MRVRVSAWQPAVRLSSATAALFPPRAYRGRGQHSLLCYLPSKLWKDWSNEKMPGRRIGFIKCNVRTIPKLPTNKI
jgi:hypothetical protein